MKIKIYFKSWLISTNHDDNLIELETAYVNLAATVAFSMFHL